MLVESEMHVLRFEAFLEAALQGEIDKVYPLHWHENTISDNLAIKLQSHFKSVSLIFEQPKLVGHRPRRCAAQAVSGVVK
jgi:hypothetical protein